MDFLSRMLKGLVVGVANIIPGVSGGTMAVVMGIYDKLIGAVSDLRRDFKNSVIYLFPIGVGALLGILLFSYLIEYLLANFTMPTNIFFLGLILGSIPMIYRRATREKLKKVSLLPFAASFAVMIVMTLLQNVTDAGSALITTLDAVALGVLLGVFWGAKLIDWCMKRFEQQTYFAILGLIAGSILPILLNAGYTPGLHTLLSVVTLAAGAAIAFWMSRMDGQQG